MIEMHWVIFVLALLVCGAIGWLVCRRIERGYRRAVEAENRVLREEASAFYKAPCVRSKKLEIISLKACNCIPGNEVNLFGRENTLERARNDVIDKVAEDARDFIKTMTGTDRMGDVRAYAELRVLMPVDEKKCKGIE